jgi:ABC-type sulfate/molybdate transport systems ATPase subunit
LNLISCRSPQLVTHHVELVLPATHYLVRLLDGRISNQGTVKELREQNLLDIIAHDAITKDAAPALVSTEQAIVDTVAEAIPAEPKSDVDIAAKKPRKLVKDEAKATGSVKWSIYKTYLEAS